MILNYLRQIEQPIKIDELKESMIVCYNHICFSTFPYISYKVMSSKEAILQYNSGNCIGLSHFLKMYLKKNYNIESFIIPSSVPDAFIVKGQDKICHCALFVPKNKYEYFILDCAFYFNEPIYVNVNDTKNKHIFCTNIHRNMIEQLTYCSISCNEKSMLSDIYGCECFFANNPQDKWCYYMNEIINPDETIGLKYHLIKKNPFLVKTIVVNNQIIQKYYLKKINEKIIISEGNNENQQYNINDIPQDKLHIFSELSKYFLNYF